MEEPAALWELYKGRNDSRAKESLLEHYLPLVKQIALGILKKLWSGIEMDDLVSDGTIGLMRAIEQFDASRGVKFETYATPVIRGAIFNGLRDLDWMPERTRAKVRSLQQAMEKFMMEHGRPGTEEEIARELKTTSREVSDLVLDLFCMYVPSLDQPLSDGEEESFSFLDVLEDKTGSDPVSEYEAQEDKNIIKSAMAELDEDEKTLIQLHYYQGASFNTVAEKMGISLQKLQQIHRRVVFKLRDWLAKRDY
ncbi:MAG: FliA/WhiG family RNA polymerase sigma factor [Candidatus Eremiobacteraeota bacterium]|nr:FliA/WhiG family RNA polymerase sigma factor [Candidatus Eremiobacteraeota bacterium]